MNTSPLSLVPEQAAMEKTSGRILWMGGCMFVLGILGLILASFLLIISYDSFRQPTEDLSLEFFRNAGMSLAYVSIALTVIGFVTIKLQASIATPKTA